MPGLRWRNPQLSHITLRPGGGGEFTPHIITSGNPHDPGFGPEAKSPRGEITHHLATLLSPFPLVCALPKVSITETQPVGECMQETKLSLQYSSSNVTTMRLLKLKSFLSLVGGKLVSGRETGRLVKLAGYIFLTPANAMHGPISHI